MKNATIEIGTKLYYTDNGILFGEVVKVLKRDVHVLKTDGTIQTNWQKSLAKKMIKL